MASPFKTNTIFQIGWDVVKDGMWNGMGKVLFTHITTRVTLIPYTTNTQLVHT